jgi:hypothetical protein
MRVIRPFRLSDRTEDSTSVEPFSDGASRAAHSSRPAFSDFSVSCSCSSSHSSSRAWDAACSSARRVSSMGGHTAVDMAANYLLPRHGDLGVVFPGQFIIDAKDPQLSSRIFASIRGSPSLRTSPPLPRMHVCRCKHRPLKDTTSPSSTLRLGHQDASRQAADAFDCCVPRDDAKRAKVPYLVRSWS